MLRFIKRVLARKAFNFSIQIKGTQDEVFTAIRNTSNWYLFDFHDLLYLFNDKVLVTKHGRGTLKMKCDVSNREVVYTIVNEGEGVWNYKIRVHENEGGSVLDLKCWGPRTVSHETVSRRGTDLGHQLEHFKILVEGKKRMN